MLRSLSTSVLVRRTAVLATAAFALTSCMDDPAGPRQKAEDKPAPELSVAQGGGAEPTHLGIPPGGGPELVPHGAAAGGSDTIPGQYIVVFKEDVVNAEGLATQLAAAHGGTVRYTYRSAIKGFAAKLSDRAVAELRQSPHVDYVEPNRIVRASVTQPMDWFGDPWGLDRIDQRVWLPSGTYTYFYTGNGVRVYIIDSGLRAGHPEFGGRAMNVYDAFGGNGEDCNGHGTHVGGTVGGSTYGVAKKVLLRGVRALGGDCGNSGDIAGIIAAVDWVRRYRIDPAVANMSLGGAYTAALNTAVTNLASSGVFVAVAAGNENQNACYVSPASAPAAFTVAATDFSDSKASFSNWGSCVDAYAPGDWIKSASLYDPDGEYKSGTSMASPHVAGVAALLKHRYGNLSSATINSWIKQNATANVIFGNVPGTPNLMLYKGTL